VEHAVKERRSTSKFLIGRFQGKKELRVLRANWEDNIKVDL
jgi:hypothetical protein